MISKRTPNELVNQMINCDLDEIAKNIVEECNIQWKQKKKTMKNLNRKDRLGRDYRHLHNKIPLEKFLIYIVFFIFLSIHLVFTFSHYYSRTKKCFSAGTRLIILNCVREP